ncbi:PGPGW domain-containing protein [Nocardioides sp.]|uniref:PGPGW domain-containing protein n=1 Tax=Nocardioides sp. TaxID=35761 RepID=UPI002B271C37|nr:PGPGW domain-containing protein [Nocardioides sp.]
MKIAKRVGLEAVGWTLLVAGIAALVLPGPGLLMIFAAMAVLSQQYEWAERRLAPIKYRALKAAAESVASISRIVASVVGVVLLFAAGALWIANPPVPDWWSFSDALWLPGGIATATTQIVSGFIAIGLLIYSYRRFHGKPESVQALGRQIEEADREYDELSQRD